jgi:hypothetical protein
MRILLSIVNFGNSNREYLNRVLDEYRSIDAMTPWASPALSHSSPPNSNSLLRQPFQCSSHPTRTPLPRAPSSTMAAFETAPGRSRSCISARCDQEPASGAPHKANAHGSRPARELPLLFRNARRYLRSSPGELPPPAHPEAPCGISMASPGGNGSAKRNGSIGVTGVSRSFLIFKKSAPRSKLRGILFQ